MSSPGPFHKEAVQKYPTEEEGYANQKPIFAARNSKIQIQ
jgi:hypothetical protein